MLVALPDQLFLYQRNLFEREFNTPVDVIEPMEVADLIKFLAIKGDLNVIVGREVTGSTKLMLKDVALGEALEIVLAANGLAYEVKGSIIKVMTDKEYRELHGEGSQTADSGDADTDARARVPPPQRCGR